MHCIHPIPLYMITFKLLRIPVLFNKGNMILLHVYKSPINKITSYFETLCQSFTTLENILF
jgi:hypothetical protein